MLVPPKISIVVPNFNSGPFLAETLESIFSQGYPNLEVILIDGGSTDASLETIKEYESKFAFHCSEPDKGHYDAVNKGMARATGEVLGYLNADDKLFPGSLRLVGDIFASHPSVEWINSLVPATLDFAGSYIGATTLPGYSREAFLDGLYGGMEERPPIPRWFIQQESSFWRRSLWDRAGGRLATEISHAGDFDLWGRFFEHAELVGVQGLIGAFRKRKGQRSSDGATYMDQMAERLGEFRKRANWSPVRLRRLAHALKLFEVRRLGGMLRKTVGYQGKRVVRVNPGSPDGRWHLEAYRFP